MKWNRVQVINTVRFFNPTLEPRIIVSDNKKYRLAANGGYADIPADVAELIYNEWKHTGVFPMLEGTDYEAAKREALLTYVNEGLSVRISNFEKAIQERKHAGMEIKEEPRRLQMWRKWRDEILTVLERQKPVFDEPSFLDPEEEDDEKPKRGRPRRDTKPNEALPSHGA